MSRTRKIAVLHLLQELTKVEFLKRRSSADEIVKRGTQTIHIALRTEFFYPSSGLLGAHERRRSHGFPQLCRRRSICEIRLQGRFVVDASGINIDEEVTIEAFDEVGAIVSGVELDPASVHVTADVAHQLAYATLPVIPELTGEPAHGKRVDNVSVLPATVTVSGDSPDIRALEAISTEPVDISDQSVELVAEVPLILPEEVTASGEELVTVLIRVRIQLSTLLGILHSKEQY